MDTIRTIVVVALLLVTAGAGPGTAAASASTAQSDCSFPYTVTDATGTEMTIEEAPETVAALQASDAQTMWEIGAREQVVAMPQNQYTSYLNDTDGRRNVANSDGSTNAEAVVGENPDIVLAANVTRSSTIQQLRSAGLTVYHFPLVESIDGIIEQTETIGRLTGNCDAAEQKANDMALRVQAIEETVGDRESPRVLYYSYSYTTGNGTHIHDMIDTAGGQNIAAAAGLTSYVELNPELVVDSDPQWLVLQQGAPGPSGAPYDQTTAMQTNQTLRLNPDYLTQPAPRFVIALQAMAEAFHPDAFADQGATNTTESTPVTTATETAGNSSTATAAETATTATDSAQTTGSSPTTTTTPAAADGPGFGVAVTVLALLGTLLLAGRRKGT